MQKLTKAPGIGNYTSKEVRMRIVWYVWSDRFRYEKACMFTFQKRDFTYANYFLGTLIGKVL